MATIKKVVVDKEDLPAIYKENTYISKTGTVGSISGAGPWTATITNMATTDALSIGDEILAISGTGSLGSGGTYIVASIVSGTSITFTATGGTTPTAGTITNIKFVSLSYNIRYRLISEDKNRVSAWSKVYNLKVPYVIPITEYSIVINNSHDLVTVTWNLNKIPETAYFDVWVRWVGAHAESNYPWAYSGTTTLNQYNFVFPATIPDPINGGTETPNKVRVAVQRSTYPKEKENYPTSKQVTVFQTNLETL